MADVRGFRGVRFNPGQVPDLDRVATQPYDKVSPEMKQRYLEKDEHSFVRLILPEEYGQSDALCREWLEQGVLKKDEKPALYVYHEEFEAQGAKHVRKGFIGALRVEEFEKHTVLPHERTLSKARTDRLNLLRATGRDYEQIFLLYSDPDREIDKVLEADGEPDITVTDEYGVIHRLWTVSDPAKLEAVRGKMQDKVLLIADGHHRYETALNFRRENEAAGEVPDDAALRFKSAAFVNVADEGLVVFPTHRLLKNLGDMDWDAKTKELSGMFSLTPVEPGDAIAELERNADGHAFVLHAGPGKTWLLKLTDRAAANRYLPENRSDDYKRLDVTILHSVIIEGVFGIAAENIENHVKYERDAAKAVARVDGAEFQAVVLMNPTKVEQVRVLSDKGERMPQKSTDFYPKLISGMVFLDVSDGEAI